MHKTIPAVIIAEEQQLEYTDIQLSVIGGIPNILRTIISLKNSKHISSIYLVSNQKNIIDFCSKFNIITISKDHYDKGINLIEISKLISKNNNDYFKDIIFINSRYPFLTTLEVDKVIESISDNFDYYYSRHNFELV